MRPTRSLLALLAVVPLGACADMTETRMSAPFATASLPASLAVEVAPDQALAGLPAEAGAVVSVTERREKDRLIQTIALAGDAATRGTNRIRVVAESHEPGRSRRPTEEAIAAELAAELPDVDMRPSSLVIAGAGGPVGLATGRSARGETCVYAWQETKARPSRGRSGLFDADAVDVSVRVRLCRPGLTEERAVALVEGLRLRADVVPLGGGFASGPTGVDALATAGYGGSTAAGASVRAPMTVARHSTPRVARADPPTPVRPVKPVSRSIEPATAKAPVIPSPAVASDRAAPPLAGVAPAVTAPPIPLPSGG
jgi:hypothetical protein